MQHGLEEMLYAHAAELPSSGCASSLLVQQRHLIGTRAVAILYKTEWTDRALCFRTAALYTPAVAVHQQDPNEKARSALEDDLSAGPKTSRSSHLASSTSSHQRLAIRTRGHRRQAEPSAGSWAKQPEEQPQQPLRAQLSPAPLQWAQLHSEMARAEAALSRPPA